MVETSPLSAGTIAKIMTGELRPDDIDMGTHPAPVVQVLGFKLVTKNAGGAASERYRVAISDGTHYQQIMIATQLNDLIKNNVIVKSGLIKINKFICNNVSERKIIIVLEAEAMGGDVPPGRIGNPQSFSEASVAAPAAETPMPDNPYMQSKTTAAADMSNPYKSNSFATGNTSSSYAAPAQSNDGRMYSPINQLNPYTTRWSIKARCTMKRDIRPFKGKEGKLFSFHLADEHAEMKCVVFTDRCDELFDKIQKGQVYIVSNGDLKSPNLQYNKLSAPYELVITKSTTIEMVSDADASSIPKTMYKFVKLSALEQMSVPNDADILGVVQTVGELRNIQSKKGNELVKLDVTIVDETAQLSVTLWGTDATNFSVDNDPHPVLAIKGARVSDFGGRSASVSFNSEMDMNPDHEDAHALKGWYDSQQGNVTVKSMTQAGGGSVSAQRKPLSAIQDEFLGATKPDYMSVKGTVLFIRKENFMYKSCATANCNRKVRDEENGKYRCEACDESLSEYNWRLMLSMNIGDDTNSTWINVFNDTAETILGHEAKFMGDLSNSGNLEVAQQKLTALAFKEFVFTLRCKQEEYQGQSSTRSTAVRAEVINYKDEAQKLYDELSALVK